MDITQEMINTTTDLMQFLDDSPTAAHAVLTMKKLLINNDFREISEKDEWDLKPGDKFFTIRNSTALIAGIIGNSPIIDTGFHVIGAHTDSPGFRIKSNSVYEKEGYIQLGVEIYGGPILATWTDRDLTLAGKIIIHHNHGIETRLWRSNKNLVRLPNVAIHMDREVNDSGLKLDFEKHLPPVIGMAGSQPFTKENLKQLIASDLQVTADQIVEFELEIIDPQKASFLGISNEFFASGRIDNLMMCHAALSALTSIEKAPDVTMVVSLFDAEEIGSATMNGGGSPFLGQILERLMLTQDYSREDFLRAIAKSFVLSADGAHAVHPNYVDKYKAKHLCRLNQGLVIKLNAKQRYASGPETTAQIELLAHKAEIPTQKYIHRTDKPCGSTIGPITATNYGITTADIGLPMVSMHSIREMAGSADQYFMVRFMKEFITSDL
ncbi:MAG: M18 family aminopeptidase [Candidatus Marinimicrobia bacterium]|nr:M18 family aminopeptidase [Candidatus Neomarinimicrobiota bacterium]